MDKREKEFSKNDLIVAAAKKAEEEAKKRYRHLFVKHIVIYFLQLQTFIVR